MKKLVLLVTLLIFGFTAVLAQSTSRSSKNSDLAYTGKRFDSYGKPLEKKKQNKRKLKTSEAFDGDMKNKSYPIGIDKDKRKKKSNYKGKKRKKGCNCPGH
jgi:hypothetical protein